MKVFEFDEQIKKGWKSYPVRIEGLRSSQCCGKPTLLVQSMDGGFVTANCPKCNKKTTLQKAEFYRLSLWVSCPHCKKRMKEDMFDKNYCYKCDHCQIFLRLADLLPYWDDLINE